MRFVLSFIKILKISRLFRQDQDFFSRPRSRPRLLCQDQDHFSCPRGTSRPRPRSQYYISSIVTARHVRACPGPAPFCPQNCPFSFGDMDAHLIYSALSSPSPYPKWHYDQFSHFYRDHGHNRQTDKRAVHL